jgi:hypothetical protein
MIALTTKSFKNFSVFFKDIMRGFKNENTLSNVDDPSNSVGLLISQQLTSKVYPMYRVINLVIKKKLK